MSAYVDDVNDFVVPKQVVLGKVSVHQPAVMIDLSEKKSDLHAGVSRLRSQKQGVYIEICAAVN